ncbi:hypothetical protein O6H91_01G169400 [Diphasiastrum complanatum]|uniref:Uncharacterized protein n=2 Tax=Diphasiastrum complanatum TaxID=34168 RepID=A0ACC2EYG7_DIPCM|nr:hypothetical protein O6H91_01G165000 [Diphasiastrum complanatum]KAJ7571623.1 hypothetical protein O6H91_01G169400 [Diphasiastrum complanatum]
MSSERGADESLTPQQQLRIIAELDALKENINKRTTQIHVTTLDSVVSVNSFFTIAVFIGLSVSSHNSSSPQTDTTSIVSGCVTGENTVKYLLVFEVVAFSCFLFSSLIAHGMKLYIIFFNGNDREEVQAALIDQKFLRFGMIAAAIGSIAGTFFLLLSMINIIQVRLGSLSCGSVWPERAAIPLIILVGSGVIVFISSVFYAALH